MKVAFNFVDKEILRELIVCDKKLKLLTLKERRERQDLIIMFKATRGLETLDSEDFLIRDFGRTRGHM